FEINGKLYLDKRSTESKVKFTVAERQRQIELDRKALAELTAAQRVAEQKNRTEPVARSPKTGHKPQRSDVMTTTATKPSKKAKAEKKEAKASKTAKPAKKEGAKSSGDLSPNQVLILQALKD